MKNLSIKNKIFLSLTLLVLITAILVGYFSQFSARSIIEQRTLETEIPATIQNIGAQINKEISQMYVISKEIASDAFILDWNASGRDKAGEALLIEKLRQTANAHN